MAVWLPVRAPADFDLAEVADLASELDDDTRAWVESGCRSAGIGCLDCKEPLIEAIHDEQAPWRARADELLADPKKVHWIVEVGTERARAVARKTLREVRGAMGIDY